MENIYLTEFLTVAVVHLLAVASPGPDFAIVIRQSVRHGKRTAIQTSAGVGTGIMIHVFYSLLGIGLIISRYIVVFNIMKFAGAAYLIFIGYKSLRAKPLEDPLKCDTSAKSLPTAFEAFRTGFLTNGLNPKATLFFLSLFTAIINHNTPINIQFGYGVYMAFATFIWFSGVSTLFGSDRVRNNFHKMGHWLERSIGVVLIALGIKLASAGIN